MLVFASCDPIEESEEMDEAITADDLDLTVTQLQVDGVNSNEFVVENNSTILSHWYYGVGTSTSAYDTIQFVVGGSQTIVFTGRNADGTEITKNIEVQIDTVVNVDAAWGYFCGEGSRTWTWNTTVTYCWGNGTYASDTIATWWGYDYANVYNESEYEGEGATMVFSTDGATLTKNFTDGTSESGTFSFDMDDITYYSSDEDEAWSIGTLSTSGVTVLCGLSPNEDNIDINAYDIISLDDDNMILGYENTTSEYNEGWFWVFSAVN